MKTSNNDKHMDYEYEQMDTEALKKRIVAYQKMSEAMQKAAEAIRSMVKKIIANFFCIIVFSSFPLLI